MVLFNLVNLDYKERYHKSMHRISGFLDDIPRNTKFMFRVQHKTKATNISYCTIQKYSYTFADQETLLILNPLTKTMCQRYVV